MSEVTDRHTAVDYAQILKEPVGQALPQRLADRIAVHAETISTPTNRRHSTRHSPPPEAPPARSKRFRKWHYTPKHGSWLDMAETELGVVSSQCLDRRIPDKQTLIEEVAAWEDDRNKNHAKADWQFTTADARVKLKRLYPTL